MFTEDPATFLADFGQPCVAGAQNFQGILDQPDEITDQAPARVHGREYELLYASAQATLNRAEALTVNAIAYTVRSAPRQIGDGLFSTVLLTKV